MYNNFLTADALAAIMSRCDNDPKRVHEEISNYVALRTKIYGNDIKIQQSEANHASRLKALHAERRVIEETCDHIDIEYIPDASGNNDCSYVCRICGKDFGRRPPERKEA